ncbi:hypothetical protein [Duganella hordei]|uniref:hypothetical protein n=1 Tax=Duganella hordei TaxID=2865934 RepID=UPI003340A541
MDILESEAGSSRLTVFASACRVPLLAIGIAMTHAPVHAAPATQLTGCVRAIRVAVSPIGRDVTISPTGEISGTTRDFLDAVAHGSGCRFKYLVVSRARAFAMFRSGDVDVIPSVTRFDVDLGSGEFVQTHFVKPMLISLRALGIKLRSVEELIDSSVTLDTVRGYHYGPSYDLLIERLMLNKRAWKDNDPDMLARKLVAGRMHAVLIPSSNFLDAAEKMALLDQLEFSELKGLDSVAAGMFLTHKLRTSDDGKTVLKVIEKLAGDGSYLRMQGKDRVDARTRHSSGDAGIVSPAPARSGPQCNDRQCGPGRQ